MITRHVRNEIIWVDLESPTESELRSIMDEFGISPKIEAEIVSPTPYPLAIAFPEYAYLVLHFPKASNEGGAKSQEIDFVVGKNFIVTARYEVLEPLHHLHKVFEAEELLGTTHSGTKGTIDVLEQILRNVYREIQREVEETARTLDRIETDIFAGRERAMVRKISEVGRILLRFETVLLRHSEVLATFLDTLVDRSFFGPPFAPIKAAIEAERAHAAALVSSYRAVVHELRNTNDSLLSVSQNEAMKVFSLVAFCTFPLAVIAAIFAMDTAYKPPFIGLPYDFWIIIGIMVVVDIAFLTFFRIKKWI